MTSPLIKLAEAVERATGPDRKLDATIYYGVLRHCRHARKERSGAQSDTGFDCLDCGADSWGNLGLKGERLYDKPPAYTASLDDAMTLVPEGWVVALHTTFEPSAFAQLGPQGAVWDRRVEATAATPALALTAAALRARSQEKA